MSIGGLPPGLRRVPRLMGGAVVGQGSAGATAPGSETQPTAAHLPSPNFSSTLVVANTVSRQALPDNPRRRYLLVQNTGANDVYLGFGSKASLHGIKLKADNSFEPFLPPGSSIHIVTETGDTTVVFVEGA